MPVSPSSDSWRYSVSSSGRYSAGSGAKIMRIFGHPIHPMLVHFPIAFWTVAVGAYVWAAAAPSESVAMVGKLANGAALVIALLTMFAGLFELRSITSGSQSMQVATWH